MFIKEQSLWSLTLKVIVRLFQNDIGSCASILGELAEESNKASQGLLTPEEYAGSPRRNTPIDMLTSVPEEDEEAQKTRTSVDLRKWKEMVENEKKREEAIEEKRRKLSRKEEEREEDDGDDVEKKE